MNIELPGEPALARAQPHIIVAYNYRDRTVAGKLAMALRRDRVSPWIEEAELTDGDSLVSRLFNSARPVDFVIPVISTTSAIQAWVSRDLPAVMTREFHRRRVIVLPAKIDNCALPASFGSHAVTDFHGLGWDRAHAAIKAGIRRCAGAAPVERPAPAVKPAPGPRVHAGEPKPVAAKRVYLSYDCDTDGYYRDILVTWSKQPDFAQFTFSDRPPNVPVESEAAEPLKRAIAAKIGAATAFLCVVGEKTSANGWVDWEIKKADELCKRIIGVRISRDHNVPETLCNAGATWSMSFTFEGIKSAMEEAHGSCSFD